MKNVLREIISKKKERISEFKKKFSTNIILDSIKKKRNFLDFRKKIINNNSKKKISIIAEIKKRSPSSGILLKKFDPLEIANIYFKNGATCLSVLTEQDFFSGNLDFIDLIKKNLKIPVLCKDFFIDTYQVALAKSYGADCILIILSAVDKTLAKDLYQTANDLNMSSLVEVHSIEEAEFALSFQNSLIGINNRNLSTLKISLDTTVNLSKILYSHKNPLISESGINKYEDIKFITENANIYNFLIGESLLQSENIGLKLNELSQINVE